MKGERSSLPQAAVPEEQLLAVARWEGMVGLVIEVGSVE